MLESTTKLPVFYGPYGYLDNFLVGMGRLKLFGKSPTIILRNYLNRFMFRYVFNRAGTIVIKTRDEFFIEVPMNDQAAASIIFAKRYSPEEIKLLSHLLPLTIGFVDIGANLGYFSLFARARTKPNYPVFSIEPNAYLCGLIENSIHHNNYDNISVICAAADSTKGKVTFVVDERLSSGGKITHNPSERINIIDAIRVDDVKDWLTEPKPFLIKIDVEGLELAVLKGSQKAFEARALFICEIFSDSFSEILRLLNEHDYVMIDFCGIKIPDSISLFRRDFLLIPVENLSSIQHQLQNS